MVLWTGSTELDVTVCGPSLNASCSLNDLDQIIKGVFWAPNPNRRSKLGRLWLNWRGGSTVSGDSPELGVAHATGHQSRHGLALRDHRSMGNPFN
jgi:hypothetical protein